MNRKNRNKKAINHISLLYDNWDSYGAKAPSKEDIELCTQCIAKLAEAKQPYISPDTDGSISLFWEMKSFVGQVIIFENRITWVTMDLLEETIFEKGVFNSTEELNEFCKNQLGIT